jgi:transcription termination/antitermination protein NusG
MRSRVTFTPGTHACQFAATVPGNDPDEPKGAKPELSMTEYWYALWTHSHCEQLVHDQLVQRGFRAFLPTVDVWSRRRGVRRLIRAPMFSGYLFIRHAMDKHAHVEMKKTRGLVRVLGARWDQLAVISDDEMESVERVAAANHPVLPFPYLREGQRVRITSGPLTGVEGFFVEANAHRGTVVVSVHLLQRSVSVAVDATNIAPTNS